MADGADAAARPEHPEARREVSDEWRRRDTQYPEYQPRNRQETGAQKAWHQLIDTTPDGWLDDLAKIHGIEINVRFGKIMKVAMLKSLNINPLDFKAAWEAAKKQLEHAAHQRQKASEQAAAERARLHDIRMERGPPHGKLYIDMKICFDGMARAEVTRTKVVTQLIHEGGDWDDENESTRRSHHKGVPVLTTEISRAWNYLIRHGGFLDISKCQGNATPWASVVVLEPKPQDTDASAMVRYRTNSRYMRKVGGGRTCVLEALLFATGTTLTGLNLLGLAGRTDNIDMGEVKKRLMQSTPFQLYGWQKGVEMEQRSRGGSSATSKSSGKRPRGKEGAERRTPIRLHELVRLREGIFVAESIVRTQGEVRAARTAHRPPVPARL